MSYGKIKQSALSLFAQRGFQGTTIKDIAEKSGLKPSSIYSHITSKNELFLDIWRECIKKASKSVEEINIYVVNNKNYDAEDVLKQYHSAITRYFIKNKDEYLFLRQTAFFSKIEENSNDNSFSKPVINEATINFFKKFFDELKDKERIIDESNEKLFYIYSGTIIAYLEEKLVYNIPLSDKYVDEFWTVFWQSVKK